MLAGLGGGQLSISKVFKLDGPASAQDIQQLEANEAELVFQSVWVEAELLTEKQPLDDGSLFPESLELDPPPIALSTATSPPPTPPPTSAPLCGRRHRKPTITRPDPSPSHRWTERTLEERAQTKRDKRELGRERRRSDVACLVNAIPLEVLPPAPRPIPVPARENGKRQDSKLSESEPRAAPVNKLRPSHAREGEQRWVVEVELRKGGRRATVLGAEAELDEKLHEVGEDEPEHGWTYLDFDLTV